MGSERQIKQLNLVDQWDEWELAPGNGSKVTFVFLLFGDLGYEGVSHKHCTWSLGAFCVCSLSEKTIPVERVAVMPFTLLASGLMASGLV